MGSSKETTTLPGAEINWGRRSHHGSWGHFLVCASIMFFSPLVVIVYWVALSSFNGSLLDTVSTAYNLGLIGFLSRYGPRPDSTVATYYGAWVIFQALLYQFLPSKLNVGQLTPAGHLLQYKTNGLLAWIVTHALYVSAVAFGYLDPAVVAVHWEGLLFAANVAGFLLTTLAYVKAYIAPDHPTDRKFSGSMVYDYYMGIELNPRIGKLWDFKLFTNGRPGIVAWTLIDLSFIGYQYQQFGFITNTILVTTALHTLYVVDFFYNEDWYLRTIDICHDHFGFYLAWGSLVWLPSIYTLQTQYLASNPVIMSNFQALFFLFTGVCGYMLFRSVNHQKDIVRRTKGECMVWGKKAEIMRVRYLTKDGKEHDSLLLCSGWWGISRHTNYMGDLILSYSMCAVCGLNHFLPWTYAVFMTTLLIHRCWRDEERCSQKYGKGWDDYCKRVKWVMLPGIY
ncbi:7-dehydrocholesterol reductase [Podosphaera aphanis]|nr:7-dehydrocholesterol reductase [Podosphaera aphanis]